MYKYITVIPYKQACGLHCPHVVVGVDAVDVLVLTLYGYDRDIVGCQFL